MSYEPPQNCVTLTRYFYPPEERSDEMLNAQLKHAAWVVSETVMRPLETFQKEALLCLVSDLVGGLVRSPSTTFEQSFLVTALNRGMFQIAAAEFYVFCYVDGKVQTRAWEKRKAEQYLFSRGRLLFE